MSSKLSSMRSVSAKADSPVPPVKTNNQPRPTMSWQTCCASSIAQSSKLSSLLAYRPQKHEEDITSLEKSKIVSDVPSICLSKVKAARWLFKATMKLC